MTDDLDEMFAAAWRSAPQPPEALMARVLADADAQLETATPPAQPRNWLAFLGGWQGLGGLAVATAAGFVIGINPADVMPDLLSPTFEVMGLATTDDYTGLTGMGWDLDEG